MAAIPKRVISGFAESAPATGEARLVKSIQIFESHGRFAGQPNAREKYVFSRLQDDIFRALEGRDPQVNWDADLCAALEHIGKRVREMREDAQR